VGAPTNQKINDPTDPAELLANANAFLQSFQDRPGEVAVPYEVTLAPISIARGPLTLNAQDIEHAQDVLAFCAKRRSALLDQLNGLQYVVDNAARFDFSNGAKMEAMQEALADTQLDIELIADCASGAINHPRDAAMPVEFAKAAGGVFPKAILPTPMPLSKAGAAPALGSTLNLTLDGILLWGGWHTPEELANASLDDKRNAIISEATKLTRVPNPYFLQGFDNDALIAKAAIIIFLIRAKVRRPEDMKTMTVDEQRATLIIENHNHTNIATPNLQAMADADLVHLGVTWAPLVMQ
jgi:hypothetical protein